MNLIRSLAGVGAVAVLALSACSPSSQSTTGPTSAPVATTAPAAPASAAASVTGAAPSPAAPASAVASPAASAVASPSTVAGVAPSGPKPAITMGSANFPEAVILGELYAQALEANGYTVNRKLNIGPREVVEPAMESGQIDMEPEYMASLLRFINKDVDASTDPALTARLLQEQLASRNLTLLDYASAVDTNGLVATQATASKYNLKKISDLTPVADQLVMGGPPECPGRPFCLGGYESVYGIKFKDFKPLDTGGPVTVQALLGNQVDVATLFTTDPAIQQNNFVLLDDDKYLQLSDNIAPVVRTDIASRAPDLKSICGSVSSKLTTEELTSLNRQVGVDRQDPKDAASAWLKSKGLVK